MNITALLFIFISLFLSNYSWATCLLSPSTRTEQTFFQLYMNTSGDESRLRLNGHSELLQQIKKDDKICFEGKINKVSKNKLRQIDVKALSFCDYDLSLDLKIDEKTKQCGILKQTSAFIFAYVRESELGSTRMQGKFLGLPSIFVHWDNKNKEYKLDKLFYSKTTDDYSFLFDTPDVSGTESIIVNEVLTTKSGKVIKSSFAGD